MLGGLGGGVQPKKAHRGRDEAVATELRLSGNQQVDFDCSPRANVASSIELNKYELRGRACVHFKLALHKNLMLKGRKPCGCCCEVCLPPGMLLVLLAGYLAADLSDKAAGDYMLNATFSANDEAKDAFCTTGVAGAVPNPVRFPQCTPVTGLLCSSSPDDRRAVVEFICDLCTAPPQQIRDDVPNLCRHLNLDNSSCPDPNLIVSGAALMCSDPGTSYQLTSMCSGIESGGLFPTFDLWTLVDTGTAVASRATPTGEAHLCLGSGSSTPGGNGSGGINIAQEIAAIKKVSSGAQNLIYSMDTKDQPRDIPAFDSIVAIQKVVSMMVHAYDLDINIGGSLGALQMGGNLHFSLYPGVECSEVKALISWLSDNTFSFPSLYNASLVSANATGCDGVWASWEAAQDYIVDAGAGNTWGLLIITSVDWDKKVFDYTLRLNHTATPWTNKHKDRFAQGLGQGRHAQYITSGFSSVQQSIADYVQAKLTSKPQNNSNTWACPMPTSAYTSSEFYTAAGSMLPLVMVLAFLYPVSKCVSGIVMEKELRLREGMLIMGLSKSAFYLSHFVSYFILLSVSCIVITLMAAGTFMHNSSAVLIFLMFELFGISVVALCLLISVFFSKSRIASIFAPLAMFITAVPKFALSSDVGSGLKNFMSLLSPVAFGYGAELMCNYEGSGQGARLDDMFVDEYSMGTAIFFILLDTALYIFLAWYLDQVMPSEYGVKKPPHFLCMPSYWRPRENLEELTASPRHSEKELGRAVVETFDEKTYEEMRLRERVRIMGLTKVYVTDDGREFQAVDRLGDGLPVGALKFYEGQIQCLLGHNGAGKTTLINMMTGMVAPTSGECLVWGNSIKTHMDQIREDLGLCPQHNILWPDMSCLEHLEFFAKLKGVPQDRVWNLANQMLDLVNLTQKKFAWSSTLSGGQKRKLSVAMSLIGGARIVFLDEPTAGMDVESRRAMWHLLRRPEVLRGRVIVLCTHYMDEADLLGDSIAIMNKGQLHSWGSSFFLKNTLGVGYNLTFAMRAMADSHQIAAAVKEYSPGSKTLSTTGSELRIQMPMESALSPETLQSLAARQDMGPECSATLHKAAATGDTLKMREAVTVCLRDTQLPPSARDALGEAVAQLRAERVFPSLFDSLDARRDELRIESYGVSVTTLEEVFMKIAMEEGIDAREDSAEKTEEFKLYSLWDEGAEKVTGTQLYVKQFGGLLLKRFHCARRDRRTLWCQYLLPVLFMLLALLIGRIGPPDQPRIRLDETLLREPTDLPVAPGSNAFFAPLGFPESDYKLIKPDLSLWSNVSTAVALSRWLLQEALKHEDDKHGGKERAIGMAIPTQIDGKTADMLFANATFRPALPIAFSALSNARLREATGDSAATIITRNSPLPWSKREKKTIEAFQIVFTGIFILIPFTFIPSNFVSFIVKERECKAKHVQIVSGVSPLAYWTSSFTFDLVAFLGTLLLAIIIFLGDDREEYVGSPEVAGATILLFLFYGASSIAASYLSSFLFSTHSQAQTVVMIVNFITGFILVIGSNILDLIDSTKDANKTLKYFYRLVPSYCLGDGIIALGMRQLLSIFDTAKGPFDWDVIGCDLFYMGLMCPIYFGLTLVVEDAKVRTKVAKCWAARPWAPGKGGTKQFGDLSEPMLGGVDELGAQEDEQVIEEREAVKGAEGREGDLVTVQNLRKVWPPTGNNTRPKVAVHNLSFGVKRGELFAFLGTNGAGKTTTMSVLSGEFLPTSGRALLGYDPVTGRKLNVVDDSQLARQSLGFCPQFDSLLDLMTPDEHLWLFARLRGIPPDKVQESVELLLNKLGLTPHRGKKAKSLSGGNRRKLSVAIALMGGPPVIFLDEPSAGMDPVARRGLWGALESICASRSVVLTTHHLEEIEGLSHLSHRVSIMVDGKLQCIGTLQQVKSKFGDAYEMELKFRLAEQAPAVQAFVAAEFPRATLEESAAQRLTYKLPKPITLGEVFRKIESNRHIGISEYSVNETSLEQVFMRISERALRDQEVSPASSPSLLAERQRVQSVRPEPFGLGAGQIPAGDVEAQPLIIAGGAASPGEIDEAAL
eukprot:TRINITY_DN4545_c1_g2_i1.p1 TRINITY_DN4545_c1_g2~~TRINITY_DN4545_c1_g2_i1.p1  ORF type:complete len:2056 (+),score=688.77 TRINITY_DN4545_c1_g2_i1:111-6278(+)